MKRMVQMESFCEKKLDCLAVHHPFWACLTLFVGLPVLALLASALVTLVLTMPFAWAFGWL